MKVPFVDLQAQYTSIQEEINFSIGQVLTESAFIGGQKVLDFENEFGKYLGAEHCISCANGTDALEIALLALGLERGDEVIVPAMSWVSTASAVVAVGGVPVFSDVLTDTYLIDPESIKESITEKTKAIIPVHLYGQIANMTKIMDIARANGLSVVEDAAQAVGATQWGKPAGVFGDMTTFSFYPSKNLGAYGDGGAIVTNSEDLAERCAFQSNLGQSARHKHVSLGRNSKLDAIQASVLSVKLKYLDNWNEVRNDIARRYMELLHGLPIKLPFVEVGNSSNFHLFVIQVSERDAVIEKMLASGVSCQLHYPRALPDLEPLKCFARGDYPKARQLSENCLSLPIYPEMTQEQVKYVAEVLRGMLE